MIQESELLYFVAYMARCHLNRDAVAESCILSTRVVCDLYRALGYRAIPTACEATALNAEAAEANRNGDDDAGYGIRVAHDPAKHGEGQFHGHVILVVTDHAGQSYVVDPSADQMSRPAFDLVIPPLAIPLGNIGIEEFLDDFRAGIDLDNGCAVIYQPKPWDTSYMDSPDWAIGPHDATLIHEMILGLVEVAREQGELPSLPELPTAPSAQMLSMLRRLREAGTSLTDASKELKNLGFTVESAAESLGRVSLALHNA